MLRARSSFRCLALVALGSSPTLLAGAPDALAEAENRAPTPEALVLAGPEDGILEGTCRASDGDGDPLSFRLKRKPRRGTATVAEKTGAITYRPAAHFHGEDGFVVEVSDGKHASTLAVTARVAPVNDAPVARPTALSVVEDTLASRAVEAEDIDGDALTWKIGEPPAKGSAAVDAKSGVVTFTPNKDANGADAFTVEVSDGNLTASARVDVQIAARNDPPAVQALTLSGREDETVNAKVIASDVDGNTLFFNVWRNPQRGTVTAFDQKTGSFAYTPNKDFHGEDSLSIDVSDGKASARAEVKITIAPANDAPILKGTALSTNEDTRVSGAVTASDVDGDALAYKLAKAPTKGEATVDGKTGAVAYAPARDQHGEDVFTIEVSDGKATAGAEVKVTVAAVNDVPATQSLSLSTGEDAAVSGKVVASDVDGDALVYKEWRSPKHGKITKLDEKSGSFTYAPDKDFHGEDDLAIDVGDGRASARAEVTIKVAPVNDAPVAASVELSTIEDTRVSGALSASDVDGDALSYSLAKAPGKGKATVDGKTGALSYAPAQNENGEDAFTVEVSDGKVAVTVPMKVAVAAVNDPPVTHALTMSTQEDEAVSGQVVASDADGDALSYRMWRQPKRGTLTALDEKSGRFTYTPGKDYHGEDDLAIDVGDGKASARAEVKIKVDPVNDAPTASGATLATREDTKVSGVVAASDRDGEALSYKLGVAPARGTATVDGKTGDVTYAPARDEYGDDAFTVEVSDGKAHATAAVKVSIAPVNDVPATQALALSTPEDESVSAEVVASDVDGDVLVFKVWRNPKRGSLSALDERSGTFSYTPGQDFHGEDDLAIDVGDGKASARAEVKIKVASVNDAPLVNAAAVSLPEDGNVSGAVVASDVDGDKLTYRLTSPPAKGEVTLDEKNGAFTFTGGRDETGEDTFRVGVFDGKEQVEATIGVTIAPLPDPPAVRAETVDLDEDQGARARLLGTDPDGDVLTFKLTSTPRLGKVVLDDPKTGMIRFEAGENQHGDDEIAFEVSDGTATIPGTLRVKVRPVNDVPVAEPLVVAGVEDQPAAGTLKAADVDGDRLSFRVHTAPAKGRAIVDAGGALRFEPAPDQIGEATFLVVANDGKTDSAPVRVTVQIENVNDAPQALGATFSTEEDVPLTARLEGRDVDGDKLTFQIVHPPARGTIDLDDRRPGEFTYAPARNINGRDSFTFLVTDGKAKSIPGLVVLDVRPEDDRPVAHASRLMSPRNGRVQGRLTGHDPEGSPIRFRIASPPSVGNVEILDEKAGTFSFAVSGASPGQVSFEFVVDDGGQVSLPGTVIIDIRR